MKLGEPRFHFREIDTTMREAAARAEAGAREGTLVTADAQTAGRGRHGRSWVSDPGDGLYFSLVLRPRLSATAALPLTLTTGLGVARAVGEVAGLTCDIRWPNDVLLGDRKLAGVLVELSADGERVRHVIVGVGVNVNQADFPDDVRDIAVSLRSETGWEYDREALLAAILRRLGEYYERFLAGGPAAILPAFERASSYVRGKRVVVEGAGRELRGVTAGLDPKGVLLLETENGAIEPVLAGSVRPWEDG